jgi:type I restriction enzyme S subunit
MIQKAKFKKTEIGMIPEDWEIKKLGDIGTLKNGINYNRNDVGEGLKVVSVKQLFRGELVSFKGLESVKKEKI